MLHPYIRIRQERYILLIILLPLLEEGGTLSLGEAMISGAGGGIGGKIYKWKRYELNSKTMYRWNKYSLVTTVTYKWEKWNRIATYTWDKYNATETAIETISTNRSGTYSQQGGPADSSERNSYSYRIAAGMNDSIKPSIRYYEGQAMRAGYYVSRYGNVTPGASGVRITTDMLPYNIGENTWTALPHCTVYYDTYYAEMAKGVTITRIQELSSETQDNGAVAYLNKITWTASYVKSASLGYTKTGDIIGTVSSSASSTYPNGGRHTDGYYYDNRTTSYSKGSTSYGQVTSANSGAYPSNGYSGSYWYVAAGSDTSYSKGSTSYGTVTSSSSSAYPNGGQSNGYWYENRTSYTQYSQGAYKDMVYSTARNTYPDNGRSGSYWYVFDGES